MTAYDGDDRLDAAEERLLVLLAAVRTDEPGPSESLEDEVMRTARWQHLVRGVMVAVSDLLTLLVEGILLMLGLRHPGAMEPPAT